MEEPGEDDKEPTDDEGEEALSAVEEEEEKEEEKEVDNITETIPSGFAPMPRYKKRRLNPPSPTRSWRMRMTPRRSRMMRRGGGNGDDGGCSID